MSLLVYSVFLLKCQTWFAVVLMQWSITQTPQGPETLVCIYTSFVSYVICLLWLPGCYCLFFNFTSLKAQKKIYYRKLNNIFLFQSYKNFQCKKWIEPFCVQPPIRTDGSALCSATSISLLAVELDFLPLFFIANCVFWQLNLCAPLRTCC